MNLTEELKSLGADVQEGLDRVMGDRDLYEMMLGMFLSAVEEHSIAPEDFDAEDLDGLIKRVHALKGITGNLALTPLFDGYTKALELLRAGKAGESRAAYEKLLPAQAAMIECIRRHQTA